MMLNLKRCDRNKIRGVMRIFYYYYYFPYRKGVRFLYSNDAEISKVSKCRALDYNIILRKWWYVTEASSYLSIICSNSIPHTQQDQPLSPKLEFSFGRFSLWAELLVRWWGLSQVWPFLFPRGLSPLHLPQLIQMASSPWTSSLQSITPFISP